IRTTPNACAMIPGCAGLLAAKRLWGQRHRREQLGDLEACQAAVDFETFRPATEFKPRLPDVRFLLGRRQRMISNHHRAAVGEPPHQADGQLAEGLGNHRDSGDDIVCYIAVSAEARTSVAELVPTVADATERCC